MAIKGTKLSEFSHGPLGEEEIIAQLLYGNAESLKKLTPEQLQSFAAYVKNRKLLPEHRAYFLGWVYQGSGPDFVVAQTINRFIAEARDNLIPTLEIPLATTVSKHTDTIPAPVEEPKEIPLDTILESEEVFERFSALHIDIRAIIRDWEEFYNQKGYVDEVDYMTTGETHKGWRELPFPTVTERAMQAFEKALKTESINYIMIDDARLSDGETFFTLEGSSQANAIYDFERRLKPSELQRLKEALTEQGIKPNTPEEKKFLREFMDALPVYEHQRSVQIVGLHIGHNQPTKKPRRKTLLDAIPAEPHHGLMSLGTYLRLVHHLNMYDWQSLNDFNHSRNMVPLLNNFNDNGLCLPIQVSDKLDVTMKQNGISPSHRGKQLTPIFIVQSDDPDEDQNS